MFVLFLACAPLEADLDATTTSELPTDADDTVEVTTDPDLDGELDAAAEGTVTVVPTAGDCTIPADAVSRFGSVELQLAEDIHTVVHATWRSEQGDRVLVAAAGGDQLQFELADTGHELYDAVLLGLKPETTYGVQIRRETAEGAFCSGVREVTTGPLPAGLPAHTMELHGESEGFLIVPSHPNEGGGWVTVVDADGDVVWYSGMDGLRARKSLDGRAILVNDFAFDPGEVGAITRIELDGTGQTRVAVPDAHTDFVEVAPGTYVTFGWEWDGDTAIGETLLEVEADGSTRELWRASDDLTPDPQWEASSEPEMWAHLNHLEYAQDEQAFYVVSRTLRAVYRIPIGELRVDWELASAGGGDFQVADDPGTFDFDPHSAVPTAEGLLVFDTASIRSGWCSAAQGFALDLDEMSVEQHWSYATEDCQVSEYLGNAVPLWNGHRLLVLALGGQIDEVDADAQLVSRLTLPEGWMISYATRVASL